MRRAAQCPGRLEADLDLLDEPERASAVGTRRASTQSVTTTSPIARSAVTNGLITAVA